jgi:hypothetical protein
MSAGLSAGTSLVQLPFVADKSLDTIILDNQAGALSKGLAACKLVGSAVAAFGGATLIFGGAGVPALGFGTTMAGACAVGDRVERWFNPH